MSHDFNSWKDFEIWWSNNEAATSKVKAISYKIKKLFGSQLIVNSFRNTSSKHECLKWAFGKRWVEN